MKPQTRSNIISILFGGAMLLFIWLFHNEKQARKEAEIISEQLILNKNKELANQKIKAEESILMYKNANDSLQGAFLVSEKRRKSQYKYFINELDKTKSVNTFSKRQAYSDSLSRTLR